MTDKERPLSMTIHSMPEPLVGDEVIDAKHQRHGRVWMTLVFLICAAPVVASYITYYFIQPKGEPRFGEFIQPTRPIPDVEALDLEGTSHRLQDLRKQWLLISVDSGDCKTSCQEKLYFQRQILAGLGKERDRIDWVWLIDDEQAVSRALQPALKEATVWRVNQAALKKWFLIKESENLKESLFLVDPMGEWMMRFSALSDKSLALNTRKDIERLLRASNSWDTAGR